MTRKALNLQADFRFTGQGTGLPVVEANAVRCEDNFAALDKGVVVVPLVPNSASRGFLAKPAGRTVSGLRARRQAALATGTFTLAIKDGDGNTLLSTATIDATTLTASFAALTLTATTANLALAAGEPLVVELVSNNSGATGGPVIVEATYAAE